MLDKDDTQGVLQGIPITRARRRQWRQLLALRRTLGLEATYFDSKRAHHQGDG